MYQRLVQVWLFALISLLASRRPALATPLQFTVDYLGGGLFQYNLSLSDPFNEPLSGLNILRANTIFGLNDSSVIGQPAGWGDFAPLPPLVDELNFFSLSPVTDVPLGGSLGGFYFQSTTDPAALPPGAFAFDVIGGTSGKQLSVPDHSNSGLLLFTSLAGLIACGWRCQRTTGARPTSPTSLMR